MESGVFICYRRADEPGFVQAVLAKLEQAIPPQDIFIDIDDITPGSDFVQVIESRLRACCVLLAIMGQKWLHLKTASGQRKIDDPNDFVRLELVTAMQLNKTVIPVLVGDTSVPQPDQLPDPLKPLARRQAFRMTHESFRADAQRLVSTISESLRSQASAQGFRSRGLFRLAGLLGDSGQARTVAIFTICGLIAALMSEILAYAFPPFATPSAGTAPGIFMSLTGNALAAVPYVAAWPIAAYISGYRSTRTLVVTTLIFFASWVIAGIYWENGSLLAIDFFPIDREIISNLVVMGGWAIYFPRLRKPVYFLAAVALALFGASANYLIAHAETMPYFAKLELASLALGVPMYILIGYGISKR